jgi:pimeloyl-ACP methyl ester carboxylesterase
MANNISAERKVIQVSKSPPINLSVLDVSPARPKQTIVFLHGLGKDLEQWRPQIDHFAKSHRVIAIDLRGHGKSDPPLSAFVREKSAAEIQAAITHHKHRAATIPMGDLVWPLGRVQHDWNKKATMDLNGIGPLPLNMSVLLIDLVEIIRKLRVRVPFVLVGHSLGGAIAAEYAKAYPYRLNQLVLIATPSRFKFTPFTALKLNAPGWLPVHLGMPRILIKDFHNQVLKYWLGAARFKELYVSTLVVRSTRPGLYERPALGELRQKMPSVKEIFQPRTNGELNQVIEQFIAGTPQPSRRI